MALKYYSKPINNNKQKIININIALLWFIIHVCFGWLWIIIMNGYYKNHTLEQCYQQPYYLEWWFLKMCSMILMPIELAFRSTRHTCHGTLRMCISSCEINTDRIYRKQPPCACYETIFVANFFATAVTTKIK